MKNTFTLLFITFLFLSCSKKNDLELIIEDTEIVIADTTAPNHLDTAEDYAAKNGTIISYKLVNNSSEAYFILLDSDTYGLGQEYFKMNWRPSLYLQSDNDSIVKGEWLSGSWRRIYDSCDCYSYRDSIRKDPYKKLGYKIDETFTRFALVNENTFVIHPGEILSFRTFITLPYIVEHDGFQYGYRLNPKKQYYIGLNLSNSKEGIFEYLTEEKKKDIKNNGYKFFEGIIYSNKVPVKFKNKTIN